MTHSKEPLNRRKAADSEFDFSPVKEQDYKKTIEELAEIVYCTFKPVRKSLNSTATESNKKPSALGRIKSA